MGGRVITSVVFFVFTLQWCLCQQLSYLLDTSPSSVAVNRNNGEVFITADSQLSRLSRDLVLQESIAVSGVLVRIELSPDGSKLVGCLGGDTRTCLVYNTSDLTSGAIATVENAHYNPENGLAIITTDDSFYLGSEGSLAIQGGGRADIFLAQYNYTSELIRSTADTVRYRVDVNGFMRHFYGGITRNDYVYYFVADPNPSNIRVLRVCDCARQDACTSNTWDALYEMPLNCRSNAIASTRVCSVDLVESFGDENGPLVVVTWCDDGDMNARNRVCAYKLSDIDNDMDDYYTQCVGGSISTDLLWTSSRTCSEFSSATPCDFGAPPGMEVPLRFGPNLVNSNVILWAGLAIVVEDVSLVYVAHSGIIEVYEVTRLNDINDPTGVLVDTINNVGSVIDISWEEESEYITVTTNDTVSLYPLEICSDADTCDECTSSFPLCGWCTVENKCSRVSQCQNSSESRRWVQSSDQCITTTVTPSQFILVAPTILNVSASPDLPEGLTYNCSFSGRGAPLVVPAIEVVAGSEYQCNITDIVTTVDDVKEVTDFSFVSIEVGIPFATSENALTIYNCTAALSCVECVDTENACGWCLYSGICSGVSDDCAQPAGVNNSFLMLDSSSSAVEVCPVVNSAPTPSGYYTQPVEVARDLILQTSNLPAPDNGFRYECNLNNIPLSATLNESDDTVTCIIPDNRVMSSSGEQTVPLDLIWTNDIVSYQLNGNPTDDIMCILYNCVELSSSCSSCIGINVAGYECGWCDGMCSVMEECNDLFITSTESCSLPIIDTVRPNRGPMEGGTRVTITGSNLGAAFSDIVQIRLIGSSTVICSLTGEEDNYVIGQQIVCETEAFDSTGDYILEVEIQRDAQTAVVESMFQVVQPMLSGVAPMYGPQSGGIEVIVSGSQLDIGNTDETRVELNGTNCDVTSVNASYIVCVADGFDGNITTNSTAVGPVNVFIDNATLSMNGVEFEFRNDPVYIKVTPRNVIPAGGITLTFTGDNFEVVEQPLFIYTDSDISSLKGGPCNGSLGNVMTCLLPNFTSTTSNMMKSDIAYTVMFGAAPGPDFTIQELTLTVRPDPVFLEDGSAIKDTSVDVDSLLRITGMNLGSVELREIVVTIGDQICEDRTTVNDVDTYVCNIPQPSNGVTEAEVVVMVGQNLDFNVGTVTYTSDSTSSESDLPIIVGATASGGVVIILLLIMCFIICCFSRRARAKDRQFSNLLVQMEQWEVEMADECKRAFTELQTDLADLVQISDDKNLPYRDFRSFAMRFLFPSSGTDHPVLNPLAVTDSSEVIPHLETFRQLIMDKKFLLLFVRTLESQHGRFSLQDKCNVASLLMVAFQNDLDYATEILQTLLSDVMHQAVSKSHPKLLLRRTESVAEKMLANWLCFLLFPYLLEQAGEPLFILYRAIKSQLEKGPVDVITGEARHSLSEEKLLRQKFEPKTVEGVVETETGESIPIKLLDCDTISQAKEKILDVLYKNTAISCRPCLLDVDLELRRSNAGIPLRDHDSTNTKDGDWTKINTLGHYRLVEMSQAAINNPKNPTPRFKLAARSERPVSGISFDHVGTIIANLNSSTNHMSSGPQVYHLTKPEQSDIEEGTGPRQGKILSEVFLTRLLSTKRILQSYVDNLFKVIFAVPHGRPLPKAIKCLFDFLDLQAAELGITDPETLHTWKTNSLFLRFWVSLIKNPDFVFDINKSATVDACLTIIAQAYGDACSTSEMKYNKNTPSAKLLYVNEVKSYKQDVQQYYSTVQSLPKLSQYDMAEYLRETAQTRQLYFVTESALYELFKFAATYSSELQDALNEEGLSIMATKLQQLQAAIKV